MHGRGLLGIASAGVVLLACGGSAKRQDAPQTSQQQPPPPPANKGITFGTQGPWPIANVTYGAADGIQELPVVGTTSDEAENRWVATPGALYLLRPGDTRFRRYDAADGLHLPGNAAQYCDDRPMQPGETCHSSLSTGEAVAPGISRIVGGGPDEVFVGYHGIDEMPVTMTCPPKDPTKAQGYGDYCDPNHHSGKVDRVRLNADGTIDVTRFDFVAGRQGAEYWHNRTVHNLAYDHFVHPHTLYVGANHGVIMLFPDRFRYPKAGEWFDVANVEWMGDHLHARVCQPGPCPTDQEGPQRMGGWYGIAIDAAGDLWHAGRWTAGAITWDPDPIHWVERNGKAFKQAFGDPYPEAPNDEGFTNEPVFKVNAEGDSVYLSGVAVCPDGRVWFSSHGPQNGTAHTVAVWKGRSFDTFDATALGLGGHDVNAIACLPDGRVVLGGATSGVSIYDPATGKSVAIRAGSLIPDDRILALEVDRMVAPFGLHVATAGGAAILRVMP